MSTQSFRDLLVWQKSKVLTVEIYRNFRGLRDFGFRDQIERASVSVMNNIAEGYGRRSDKSFRQFLLIAKGSAAEVESMLILAKELEYIDNEAQTELLDLVNETGKMLSSFAAKLSAKDY
ncbi:MAG TPA: four helix bundle protein [Candidatus Saccharimonadales bacterium]|nr:four helix bundle protein [Candidatus Saccharimonadales bacterium]